MVKLMFWLLVSGFVASAAAPALGIVLLAAGVVAGAAAFAAPLLRR